MPTRKGARKELPRIKIMNPVLLVSSFDDPKEEWDFDFKYDGFRGVFYKDGKRVWFISKEGNLMVAFYDLAAKMAEELKADQIILDGEIVVFDESDRPIFNALKSKWSTPTYVAFDLLWLDGEDLRSLPLHERRRRLQKILPRRSKIIRLVHTVRRQGIAFFKFTIDQDLEGIIAKRRSDPYRPGRGGTKWFKIKNKEYSQAKNRKFSRRRRY